jgi:hypothetical protein
MDDCFPIWWLTETGKGWWEVAIREWINRMRHRKVVSDRDVLSVCIIEAAKQIIGGLKKKNRMSSPKMKQPKMMGFYFWLPRFIK